MFDSKKLVSIGREEINGAEISGFILETSDELMLIQEVYDFMLDGLKVVRHADVTDVTQFETDIFQTERLHELGVYDQVAFDTHYKIDNLQEFLSSARKDFDFFILEDEPNEDFYLGKIEEVQADKIIMKTCDGAGKWHEKLEEISYENITTVQVGNRYSKVYADFMMKKVS